MKQEDKAAFEAWYFSDSSNQCGHPETIAENAFNEGLAHRDAQPAAKRKVIWLGDTRLDGDELTIVRPVEPEAYVRVKNGKIVGHSVHEEMPDGVYALMAQGSNQPAVAVNEQLLEALKHHQHQTRPIQSSIDAIAAAEEAKESTMDTKTTEVDPIADADEMNSIHGEQYGVDWVYPPTKTEQVKE